jgi:hypothetical protein
MPDHVFSVYYGSNTVHSNGASGRITYGGAAEPQGLDETHHDDIVADDAIAAESIDLVMAALAEDEGAAPQNLGKGHLKPSREAVARGDFNAAISKEFSRWKELGVLGPEVVRPSHAEVRQAMQIVLRLTYKSKGDGLTEKARAVVLGNTDRRDKGWINTYSGVCDPGIMRLAIVFALYKQLKQAMSDVKTAFLQAEATDPLMLRAPKHLPPDVDLKPGGFYRQMKAVYGTIDAPRLFTQQFKKEIATLGFTEVAESFLVKRSKPLGEAEGFLGMYVDDLHTATDDTLGDLKKIDKIFQLDDPEPLRPGSTLMYVGQDVSLSKDSRQCYVGQRRYAEGIVTGLSDKQRGASGGKIVLTEKDLRLAVPAEVDQRLQPTQQQWVGRAGWLQKTQRYLSVPFSEISRNNTKPSDKTVLAAKRVCEYAKDNHTPLVFDNSVKAPALVMWVDAAFCLQQCEGRLGWELQIVDKSQLTRGSLDHTVIQLPKDTNVLAWRSRRIKRKLASSTAAELVALREGVKEVPRFRRVIKALWGVEPLVVYATDNQPLVKWLNSKWIDSDPEWQGTLNFVIERIQEEGARVIWVPTAEQRADKHTKFIRHTPAEKQTHG